MSQSVLKRTCMRDQIRDALVTRILDGTYPAGTQLKELALAREFNVSQAPIREALRELEGSGLVRCERFRSTLVCGTDFTEMRESYELREMLETRAVHLAAPYTPELLADLNRLLNDMSVAIKDGDPERYIDYALRFHRRLIQSSGNRTFLGVWDSLLWDVRGRIVLRRFADMGKSLRPFLDMHRALLARLRAQDRAGAAGCVCAILKAVSTAFGPTPPQNGAQLAGSHRSDQRSRTIIRSVRSTALTPVVGAHRAGTAAARRAPRAV